MTIVYIATKKDDEIYDGRYDLRYNKNQFGRFSGGEDQRSMKLNQILPFV